MFKKKKNSSSLDIQCQLASFTMATHILFVIDTQNSELSLGMSWSSQCNGERWNHVGWAESWKWWEFSTSLENTEIKTQFQETVSKTVSRNCHEMWQSWDFYHIEAHYSKAAEVGQGGPPWGQRTEKAMRRKPSIPGCTFVLFFPWEMQSW